MLNPANTRGSESDNDGNEEEEEMEASASDGVLARYPDITSSCSNDWFWRNPPWSRR